MPLHTAVLSDPYLNGCACSDIKALGPGTTQYTVESDQAQVDSRHWEVCEDTALTWS